MLRIKGSAGHSHCTDLYALLNNFEHRVFCTRSLLLYKGVLVRVLNLHRDQTSLAKAGEGWKILSETGCCAQRVLLVIPVVQTFTLS